MARATRRTFLGGSALAALSGLPAAALVLPATASAQTTPAAHPDAQLLALADRFMVMQKDVVDIDAGRLVIDDATCNALIVAQSDLMEEMDEHVATTIEGHRARARVIKAWFKLADDGDAENQIDGHRVVALFRDLLGETV